MTIDVENCYRSHGPMVLRRCRALLGNEDWARDAMHDVFVKLMNNEESLRDFGLSSLLYRIATNTCLNRIRDRKQKREQSDTLLERIADAEDLQRDTQARSVLGTLFDRVPESTGTMAVMHLYDGLTLQQVAAEFGLSVSGVRRRLRGLRAELQELEASL